MLTETSFDTGEIIINVAESDTVGPPLVMLHGSTLNWQTFDELIPTFEQSWHIYACDSPRLKRRNLRPALRCAIVLQR